MEMEQEEDRLEVEFELEIEGATPNSVFDVTVDGVVVGQITTDEFGNGELNFSNDPDGTAEVAFLDNFPEIGADSVVTVGNEAGVILQGTFALGDGFDTASDGGSDGDSDGACDGASDGGSDGASDGVSDGASDGLADGASDEASDGASDGLSDGASDGACDAVLPPVGE
jgi:hypothetical protein